MEKRIVLTSIVLKSIIKYRFSNNRRFIFYYRIYYNDKYFYDKFDDLFNIVLAKEGLDFFSDTHFMSNGGDYEQFDKLSLFKGIGLSLVTRNEDLYNFAINKQLSISICNNEITNPEYLSKFRTVQFNNIDYVRPEYLQFLSQGMNLIISNVRDVPDLGMIKNYINSVTFVNMQIYGKTFEKLFMNKLVLHNCGYHSNLDINSSCMQLVMYETIITHLYLLRIPNIEMNLGDKKIYFRISGMGN